MKGDVVTDLMYVTRVLKSISVSAPMQQESSSLPPHLEKTESKTKVTLNLDGKIWENKEAAI